MQTKAGRGLQPPSPPGEGVGGEALKNNALTTLPEQQLF